MIRNKIGLLLTGTLTASLLVGCGSTAATTTDNTEAPKSSSSIEMPTLSDMFSGSDHYRAFISANTDSYDEYMIIFYNSDGTLTKLLDECHFHTSAGFTPDYIYSLDPDTMFLNFSDAGFTSVEVEDAGDDVDYLLWFEDLDQSENFQAAVSMGIISSDDEDAVSISADDMADFYLDKGLTEVATTDYDKDGLHFEHSANPYKPDGSDTGYSSVQDYFEQNTEDYEDYCQGISEGSGNLASTTSVSGNIICTIFTMSDYSSDDFGEEEQDTLQASLDDGKDNLCSSAADLKAYIGLDTAVHMVFKYVTDDGTILGQADYSSDGSYTSEILPE